ncbi:hypothetical protein H8Z58_23475 [Mycolicibacterium fortuitum]|nr:hypothetical protein [Mycolicibacterium fortuitum]
MKKGRMDRRMIVKGQLHQVDCAVREDGSAPAGRFLDALKKGMWDRADAAGPVDEQISDYHWFLNAIAYWANTGEPVYRDAVKALRDGVWEFRHDDKRLTFFDTDGNGGYTAKLPAQSHSEAEAPDSEYWQIPYFDHLIRLGHAFTKVSQKTSEHDLAESQTTREEDLAHDRPTRSDADR